MARNRRGEADLSALAAGGEESDEEEMSVAEFIAIAQDAGVDLSPIAAAEGVPAPPPAPEEPDEFEEVETALQAQQSILEAIRDQLGVLVQISTTLDSILQQTGAELIDGPKTADTELDDTQSLKQRVTTEEATDVITFVDNGTADGTPAAYDLTQRIVTADGRRFYDAQTGLTKRSIADPAIPPEWEVEIENASGNNNQPYRVLTISVRRPG